MILTRIVTQSQAFSFGPLPFGWYWSGVSVSHLPVSLVAASAMVLRAGLLRRSSTQAGLCGSSTMVEEVVPGWGVQDQSFIRSYLQAFTLIFAAGNKSAKPMHSFADFGPSFREATGRDGFYLYCDFSGVSNARLIVSAEIRPIGK